ncbi:MAG: hypothetical protein K6E62_09525 [Lachnospiraceae bacterium]|nr:hypothetical protein [Lachnospiraceae bacterium]
MGWYDTNPVHFGQTPPEESAKKYVEYLGDTDEVLRQALGMRSFSILLNLNKKEDGRNRIS